MKIPVGPVGEVWMKRDNGFIRIEFVESNVGAAKLELQ